MSGWSSRQAELVVLDFSHIRSHWCGECASAIAASRGWRAGESTLANGETRGRARRHRRASPVSFHLPTPVAYLWRRGRRLRHTSPSMMGYNIWARLSVTKSTVSPAFILLKLHHH